MTKLEDKIALIKKEIRETPYHKGTEHHIGRLKARLAKAQNKLLFGGPRRAGGFGFAVKKEGDATVVLVGPPSVGKSTLLNRLTDAHARVEPWPFTTLTVIPGILVYRGARIQVFDLPGIISGAASGSGRGREVLNVAKTADLILLIVDVKSVSKIDGLVLEMKEAGIESTPLLVVNKSDIGKPKTGAPAVFVSAKNGEGLEDLKGEIWGRLGLLRIYLKPRWSEVDLNKPLIMKKGSVVGDVAKKIFPDRDSFKQILLWGPSAVFPGQPISIERELKDEDLLFFA